MLNQVSHQFYYSPSLLNFRITVKKNIYATISKSYLCCNHRCPRSISTTTRRKTPISFNNDLNSKIIYNDNNINHNKPNLTNNYSPVDSTHFFTSPNRDEPSSKINNFFSSTTKYNDNIPGTSIGEAIKQHQNRKRRFVIWFTLSTLLSLFIGYKIIYKVVYLKRDSYIPLFPCNKFHKLTPKEEQKLNINNVKDFIYTKLMSKLTSHDFIKDHYGVPLRIPSTPHNQVINNDNDKNNNSNNNNKFQKFNIWCEDEDLVVFGILFKPNDDIRIDCNNKKWHLVPGLFKWKFSHQSVNIMERIQDVLDFIGLKYDKMITPEVTYDTFKYEVPIHFNDNGDINIYDSINNNHHAMHICFNGELSIDDKSVVRFEGKYHVDVKFEEISLTRRENDGNLVKYILYNNNEQ